MQALVIRKLDRSIISVVPTVTEVVGNSIYGADSSAEGINLDEAEIVVVDSEEEFKRGQVFPVGVVNHIAEFVKMKPEEIIAQLQAENAELRQQVAQTNADFTSFQDFYFEKNPEQA